MAAHMYNSRPPPEDRCVNLPDSLSLLQRACGLETWGDVDEGQLAYYNKWVIAKRYEHMHRQLVAVAKGSHPEMLATAEPKPVLKVLLVCEKAHVAGIHRLLAAMPSPSEPASV